MTARTSVRNLVPIWLRWAAVMLAFQQAILFNSDSWLA